MYNDAAKDISIAFFNNELMIFIAFIATIAVVAMDRSMAKRQKVLTTIFALLCMIYTCLAFVDFGISEGLLGADILLRQVSSTLRFLLKPVMLVLITASFSDTLYRSVL